MTLVCPDCGSINLELMPDGSGKCRACGRVFPKAVTEEAFRLVRGGEEMGTGRAAEEPLAHAVDTVAPSMGHGAAPGEVWIPPPALMRRVGVWEDSLGKGCVLALLGAPLFLVSIAVSLYLMLILMRLESGVNISFWDMLDSLQRTGASPLVVLGAVMQVLFFLGALGIGLTMREGSEAAAGAAIVFGIFAAVLSLLWFGGLVGAIGGGLVLAGGLYGLK